MRFFCGHCKGVIRESFELAKHVAAFIPHHECGYETFFSTFIPTPWHPDPPPGEVRPIVKALPRDVNVQSAAGEKAKFVRVLGLAPVKAAPMCEHQFDFQTLTEAFGPCETKSFKRFGIAFWNFSKADSDGKFSLVAKIRYGQFDGPLACLVVAPQGESGFNDWLTESYSEVMNGQVPPMFISNGCIAVIEKIN